jgi:hypothetical protein
MGASRIAVGDDTLGLPVVVEARWAAIIHEYLDYG